MDDLKDIYFVMSVVAPRHSGKSFFIAEMLRNGLTKQFDKIHVFCPSVFLNDDFLEFMLGITRTELQIVNERIQHREGERLPDTELIKFEFHDKPESDTLEGIIRQQLAEVKRAKADRAEGRVSKKADDVLVILDDCLGTVLMNGPKLLNYLASNGRHAHVSLIVLSQHFNRVPRTVRNNNEFLIMFAPFNFAEAETYYEQFIPKQSRRNLADSILHLWDEDFVFVCTKNFKSKFFNRLTIGTAKDFIHNTMKPVNFASGKRSHDDDDNDDEESKQKRQKSTV